MSDLAAVITSIVGALAAAGGAVKWFWVKIEKRARPRFLGIF